LNLACRADKSAAILVASVKVRMEVKYSIPLLSLHDLLGKALPLHLPLPLPVDKSPLCVPINIVLQLFTPRDHIPVCGLQHSVSALGIDGRHSATVSPVLNVIIVSLYFSENITP